MQFQLLSISFAFALCPSLSAQTAYDFDRTITPTFAPPGVLTEGPFPSPPIAAIPPVAMGLGPLDEIDALSFGDDHAITIHHSVVFSVDTATVGTGAGTVFEFGFDTAPGIPPGGHGDLFVQDAAVGNTLAPAGLGFAAGTLDGDEHNAGFAPSCGPAACEDLDAFDYSDPALATGVYFSLKAGSPTLGAIGATPGDVLYSELSGALPIIAKLEAAGLATAVNLGIAGMELDALNVVGTTGPVASGGGVIALGVVGPTIPTSLAISTHLLEFSVGGGTGMDADLLLRIGPATVGTRVFAPGIGLLAGDNINALEATQCAPTVATSFAYNGAGINLDTLTTTPAVIGSPFVATIAPQAGRGAGPWVLLMRSGMAAGPVLDLGPVFSLPAAGASELLVGGSIIANFFPGPHGGHGAPGSFTAPVPTSCLLMGSPWHAQAIVFGDLPSGAGILDPWFSSAVGGVVGTY